MKQRVLELIKKLRSGVASMLSANVINNMIGMVSTMIITRLLTTDEYGVWSYTLNIYSYLLLVTGFGLISGALQFGMENKGKGNAFAYFRYCVQKGLLIDFALIVVVGIGILAVDLPIREAKPYVMAILPILLLEFIVAIGQIVLRTQNRIRECARALNVNSIAIAVGTCGGAFWGLTGIVIGRYMANVVSVLYEGKLLIQEVKSTRLAQKLSSTEVKQLWHFSLFAGASSAMNCLVYYIDVSLIGALIKSATDISIYKVGTLIPNALQFIPTSVVAAMLPTIIYQRDDLSWVKSNLKKIYVGLFAANTVICAALYVMAPLVIRIVSGEQYLPAVPVLRVLTFGYFFSGTFRSLSVNILGAFRRVHYGLFVSIMSCLTDVVFNYFFIIRLGMIGAAYATLLVDLVTATLSFGYVILLLHKGTINEIHRNNR